MQALKIIQAKLNTKKATGYIHFLMITPFLALLFIFAYYPLWGWVYAFFDWRPPLPLFHDRVPFVGLHWFRTLFENPVQVRQIIRVLQNTFGISGLGILTSWFPIAFAIMLSEIRSAGYRRSIQTLTTLPNFISWVLIFSMAFALFSADGMLNNFLMNLGITDRPIMFLQSSENVWLTMTAWRLWQSLGWGAIIYLAAIMGIDPTLYEAARVDGAGRFRLIWHITIPGVLPTYTVLLLLSIANFLNTGFDQFFVFSNAFNMHRIQVLDLYVYNVGIMGGLLSLGTAISMLRSIVSLILLFSVNGIAKLIRGDTII